MMTTMGTVEVMVERIVSGVVVVEGIRGGNEQSLTRLDASS
jgi:hypothetical protein